MVSSTGGARNHVFGLVAVVISLLSSSLADEHYRAAESVIDHNSNEGISIIRSASSLPSIEKGSESDVGFSAQYFPLEQIEINATEMTFPRMPAAIRAVLHQDWDALDPDGVLMMNKLSRVQPAVEFAHARGTFLSHLQGTFGILAAWQQPEQVRRTGLMHTAYSGDLFSFYLFDHATERHSVREILGTESEALVYLFGTIHRGMMCDFASVINRTREVPAPLEVPQPVLHRMNGTMITISAQDAAHILMVTLADYLDQLVDVNGWRDHHQIDAPDSLYPGDGHPGLGLYWITAVCQAIREHLQVIPAVFDSCQSVLKVQDEELARDKYWHVVMHEHSLSFSDKVTLLEEATAYNPFVGEPHFLLAQLHYSAGHYASAARHARKALEAFYLLASAWDKRRTFEHWVGFSRLILLRSIRMLRGEMHSLPKNAHSGLISLHQVVAEMERLED